MNKWFKPYQITYIVLAFRVKTTAASNKHITGARCWIQIPTKDSLSNYSLSSQPLIIIHVPIILFLIIHVPIIDVTIIIRHGGSINRIPRAHEGEGETYLAIGQLEQNHSAQSMARRNNQQQWRHCGIRSFG